MKSAEFQDIYELTPLQEAMLVQTLVTPDSTAYHLRLDLELRGKLDEQTFQSTWNELLVRHSILRTSFVWEDLDRPFQVVHWEANLPVTRLDWREMSAPDQEANLESLIEEERSRVFDLLDPPLARAALIRLTDDVHRFILIAHHIVLEGWSLAILVREAGRIYDSIVSGRRSELPPARPFVDYIRWLRQRDQAGAEAFWRERLRGFVSPTRLPLDRPRGSVAATVGDNRHRSLDLSEESTTALKAFARRNRLTLNTILQGAWALLLSRYTGDSDVVFGAAVSGRPGDLPGADSIVGMFVNTLPTRVVVDDNEPVVAWLEMHQRRQAEMGKYESTALRQVQSWSELPGGEALFENVFGLQNWSAGESKDNWAEGLSVRTVTAGGGSDQPLTLSVVPGARLKLSLVYDRDRFDVSTIERMLDQYRTILESMVTDPGQSVSAVSMQSEEERHRLLVEWNQSPGEFSSDRCIHESFETQAARTPDATAVVFEDQRLTYGELNVRSNRLAHSLRARGVGPDVLVGLHAERSPDLIVGILGVLKAGGAYVPLDPAYPAQRLAFMLSDGRMPILLTQERLVESLPEYEGEIIRLDADWPSISGEPSTNPENGTAPEDVAYVIYTSGSTGKPKGVPVEHRNVHRLFTATEAWYGFDDSDVWTLFHSSAFDFSVWEIWGALLYGGRLVVVPYVVSRSPEEFRKLLSRERVTVLNQTPSAFRQLVQADHAVAEPGDLALRLVIFGGEALELQSLRPWFERHGDKRPQLVNMYGITETTVHVTYRPLRIADVESSAGSVVGRPIPDLRVYILDQHRQPVPIGVPGEIYVGGAGVARGYLNRPELTAERFVPDPFGQSQGGRLYRTGDVARYLSDGDIEHLGRNDDQIKIRGFRVELGEIESVLAQHPAVGEVVATMRDYGDGDRRLQAHVVPTEDRAFPVVQLARMRRGGRLDGFETYDLPNGMTVVQLNRNETEFLYEEIFDHAEYSRHDIVIRDGDCVFDVGANIGLFSLAVGVRCPKAKIYAFEPVPPVCEIMRLNAEIYGLDLVAFECGLSGERGSAEFVFYPKVSILSGRYANESAEREIVKSFVKGQQAASDAAPVSEAQLDELLTDRLETQTVTCALRTVTDVMREHGVERIDLLKVDVEKSELDVLAGIEEQDWPRIRQLVVEVHDVDGSLETVERILSGHGYLVAVEQETGLEQTNLYVVYGRRPDAAVGSGSHLPFVDELPPRWSSSARLTEELKRWSEARLAAYMVPWAIGLLDRFPLTANGKVDRRALPAPSGGRQMEQESVAPRSETEAKVAEFWRDLLKIDEVGIHDNFFDLGGHSLMATQLISRLRKSFGVELPMRTIFEHPTIAVLAAMVRDAAAAAGASEGSVEEDLPLVAVARDGSLPLSFAQQRLWFLDQLGMGSSYIIPQAFRLSGPLDETALRRAFDEIVQRHEVLRTTYATVAGEAVQEARARADGLLALVDLRGVDEHERQVELGRSLREASEVPFDLAQGPLLRATLLQLDDDERVLLLVMHHIVTDGWSIDVLFRELGVLYDAFRVGKASPLPELELQYADFAVWQRRWLSGSVLDRHVEYWKEKLTDLPALELPTDRARSASPGFRGDAIRFQLGRELISGLRALSRDQGCTLAISLVAAFQVLMSRYAGQDDVVVGTPIANRNRPEIENLIGFFVNNLVLRTDLSGDPSFAEALRRVQATSIGAYEHAELPFERLVDELGIPRDLSRNPLFQVMFALQNVLGDELSLAGLEVQRVGMEVTRNRFDLEVYAFEGTGGMSCLWVYDTDLFDRATIERMSRHFESILRSVVDDPGQRLSRVPLLSAEERRQLIVEWNDTAREYPSDCCLHELFEEQVARTPDATAMVFEDRRLTYDELNTRANQMARHLLSEGVGPETMVGISMERSPEMVVAILGVLKSGGAYVPLDPSYPKHRVAFMLEDSRAPVLLTQRRLVAELSVHAARTVCVDSDWNLATDHGGERLDAAVAPDNLAYVIYTSGSTGRPKGVLLSHRGAVALVRWAQEVFASDDLRGVLAATSICFDLSVYELFVTLSSGGTVILADDALALPELGSRNEVTLINTVPSAIAELVRQDAIPDSVRTVNLAGEPLLPELVDKIYEAGVGRVYDLYGPSETTTYSTFVLRERGGPATIGRPVTNERVYILDAALGPVPVGAQGELFIGGVGLARGYLNDPALTADRFIPDPFGGEPSRRLFRTGDLARWRADGSIEFRGRMDHQVKVRGFRIELGEIASVLREHPAIADAVAMAREDRAGDRRLVAYVVPTNGSLSDMSEVQEFLNERVPGYMVPSALVQLESFPLTPSGKVDRNALPAPDLSSKGGEFVAPRNGPEEVLCAIWGDVLGVDRVGVHDNFFGLGGDSILSIQIITRARQEGLHLAPRQMFQHQTVAELASVVESTARSSIAAEQGPVVGEVPLTPIQHWFFEQERIEPQHYNQALLFSVRERVDPAQMERAVVALLVHHDALRSRFTRSGAGWRQVIVDPGGQPPFEHVDLSSLGEEEQQAALSARVEALQASLDLAEGPLVRVAQFDLGRGRPGRLLIAIHHLAVDAVSWRILREDLQRACEQLARGERVELSPKTTSYRQWAERLAAHAQSDGVRAELETWVGQRWDDVGELPTEGPASANVGGQMRYVSVTLSEAETQALLREVPRAYNTQIDDVLLTALAQSLAAWTGRPRLLVDMEGHGREDLFDDVDLSRSVGWFTSICPVLVDVGDSGGQPLAAGDALKSVKEQLRSVPNRGIGYGLLRYLTDDGRLRALPRPQVSFNYLGQLDQRAGGQSLFDMSSESVGELHSPRDLRPHLLDVTGAVRGGRLTMGFLYGSDVHDAQTIETVAERYRTALVALIEHCTAAGAGGCTPSDFPLANVDQESLDRLVAEHGPDAIEDLYALSPMQLGMLFHDEYDATTGVYIEQLRFDIEELEADPFERAWEQVIDRHPVLRTSIIGATTETPAQLVHRSAPLRASRHDCRDLEGAAYDAWVDEYLREDRRRGFDLSEPGLMRLAIVHLGGERHQFIWTFHHIILDGWSFPRVLDEVLTFYAAVRSGREANLPAVAPYRDYIGWLGRQDEARTREYWKRTLAGFETPTIVTPSSSRVGSRELVSQYDAEWTSVAPGVTEALQSLARDYQLTLNTLVVGAWGLLLSRYSGEDDVVFGTIVSGRPPELPGIESAIGMFINVLPLRVKVKPDETLGQWLSRLQDQQAELRQYEHSPLWETQRESEVPPGSPLFQCIFAFENYPTVASTGEPGQPAVRVLRTIERTGYPLSFTISPQLSMRLVYDSNQFDASAIQGVLGHFKNLLESFAVGVEQPVRRFSMLSDAERQQVLSVGADEARSYRTDLRAHELFEVQAASFPDAEALTYEDQCLTYAELNARANRVAHYLRARGVGPEVLVGVCIERSLDLVIAVLGVLKSGGAYVPLDTGYPKQRLSFILGDSRMQVLLTQSHLTGELPEDCGEVVCLEASATDIDRQPETNPAPVGTPGDTAYVIYTSGSTGTPKGVPVQHDTVARLFAATETWYGFDERDVWTLFHSCAFDFSVWEIWGALLYGGRLVVVPYETSRSPEEFHGLVRREGVTVLNQTPSAFRQFINADAMAEGSDELALRYVIFGGEALELESLRPWFERHGDERPQLVNMYGITETTVHVTYRPLGMADLSEAPGSVIGRPIPDLRVLVLDAHGQPCPIGVPGELYVGGAGVARGYLGRPVLTAERFVPDPFHAEPGGRLYRTGDVARLLANGDLEYLGRNDDQVKVRGFRIELGEIEAALLRHDGVREAVAMVREDDPGNRRIVAYVVTEGDDGAKASALRVGVAEQLPQYMVPAAFVPIESVPLTAHGKVDHGALPEPPTGRQTEGEYVAPRSETEAKIAEIWRDVLKTDEVGIHDNFFDLGGHSLLVTQVVSRIRSTFAIDLQLHRLFERPTLASLAEEVEHIGWLAGRHLAGPQMSGGKEEGTI